MNRVLEVNFKKHCLLNKNKGPRLSDMPEQCLDNGPFIHLTSGNGIFAIAGIEAHCGDLFFHVFTPYLIPYLVTVWKFNFVESPLWVKETGQQGR